MIVTAYLAMAVVLAAAMVALVVACLALVRVDEVLDRLNREESDSA